jgi:hypothetical protein
VTLTSVPGIGRKGAQRIVLELAGRLGSPGDGLTAPGPARLASAGAVSPWREQVRAGLVSLGWQAREADLAIAAIEPDLLAAAAGDGSAVGDESGAESGTGPDRAGTGPEPQVDVSVALRAALRALGRP